MNARDLHPAYKGLYADGAMIKTDFDAQNDDVVLTLTRSHDAPDEVYVITEAQANEMIFALSAALLKKWEYVHDGPPDERP